MPYEWIKALHVISVIAWMAGMLYLPRLYVYHAGARPGSELSETLKLMERRLLRGIVNPAMMAAYVFGAWMLALNPAILGEHFMQAKLGLVLLMQIDHACLARWRRAFAEDRNIHSARFYRAVNELPALLVIGIVVLIVVRPQF